ncbi:MAG TPA: type III pantothenate kinase [Trueperaceae bacterium]
MLLAVDVGNTSTVMGLYDGQRLVAHWRVATNRARMADQYAVFLKSLLELEDLPPPARAVISSVAPPVERELSAALRRYWRVESALVTSSSLEGLLSVETDNPREVGADRLVNAVAALGHGADAYIIVDFGTATNFDLVVRPNRLLGVALAPGPLVAAEALFSRAAKLPRVELVAPPAAVGKNTVTALQSGLVFGYAEMVDGMVERIKLEIEPEFEEILVIATGGFADVVEGHCREVDLFEPMLTLQGLRKIADQLGL